MPDPIQPAAGGHLATCPHPGCSWEAWQQSRHRLGRAADQAHQDSREGHEPMKALTLRQPWTWAVLAGGKDVENRSRNVIGDHRGLVLVHAGQQLAEPDAFATVLDLAPHMPTLGTPGQVAADSEGILGAVTVVDVHHWDHCQGLCSEWAMPGHHHITLTDPVVFPKRIPAKGALGLWTVDQATAFLAARHLPEEVHP